MLMVKTKIGPSKISVTGLVADQFIPKDEYFYTVKEITELLKDTDSLHIEKETKSVFKGDKDLACELKNRNIEEIHIVGVDTNDCVLATAYESFDLGFFTYVIEECTESSDSERMRNIGLEVLQHVNITNNSCTEGVDYIEVNE